MRSALVAILVLGCGGSGKPAQAPNAQAPACAAVADAMMSIMLAGKEQTPRLAETSAGFNEIIRTRCDADGWTAEARSCLAAMKNQADAERCGQLLTEEQTSNLVRDQKAKFGGPEPAMAPPPPAPASGGAPPMKEEKTREAPKKSKGSPKPGDPCDGGE
jgi:hypothetical protein